jgi:calcineurin-like phosphoesterase family protein
MTETFFIGDTHFGLEPEHRRFSTIEEHDADIIRRWNATVGPKDIVFHLGDFCFGKHNIAIAGELNGDKRLILGNHDTYPSEDYLKYFTKLHGVTVYKKYVLSHIPIHPESVDRWQGNIHGHLHHAVVNYTYDAMPYIDYRYINVSCERIGLTPISFDEIMKSRP